MKIDKGAPWRAGLYAVAIVYLFLDLFLFHGPLSKRIRGASPDSAEAIEREMERGVVARVFYQPILLTQVDRGVEEYLWKRGEGVEGLTDERLQELRLAVLSRMFDEHLLRIKIRFNAEKAEVGEEELAREVREFKKRFPAEKYLEELTRAQGWEGEKELVARVGAKMQQEKYLENHVVVEVDEEELRAFYDENSNWFRLPERRKVRHIFFAALDHPDGEARERAQEVMAALEEGRGFGELAEELSDDARSRQSGGELGWVEAERLPKDLAEAIFGLPLGTVTLVESSLGAHVMEVTEVRPEKQRSFEEVKDELSMVLSNRKREQGLRRYLDVLRARERHKLEIFEEVLQRPWSL